MKKLTVIALSAIILMATACTQYIYVPSDIWGGGGSGSSNATSVSTVTDLIGAIQSARSGDRIRMDISTDDTETPSSTFPIAVDKNVTLEGGFEYKSSSGAYAVLRAAADDTVTAPAAGITLFKIADTANVRIESLTVALDSTTAAEVASVISVDKGKLSVDSYSVVVPEETAAPAAIALGENATAETLVITDSKDVQITIDENNENIPEISAGLPQEVTTPNDAATYDEFIAELTETGTVRLTADINETLAATFTFPESHSTYAINLNGKTLSITGPGSITVPAGATLDLKNGTFNLTMNDTTNGTKANLCGDNDATISLDHVKYTGSHSALYPNANHVTISITDSTVTAKGVYGVSTNAKTPVVEGEKIYITRSTVQAVAENGDSTGVLINVPGILEITDSAISGGRQGVVVRGGTATITGSTIESTAAFAGNPSFNNGFWTSGNEVAFAALCVGSYTEKDYAYPSVVTVTDTDIILGETDRTDASRIAVGCAIQENNVDLKLDRQADVDEANAHISVKEGFKDNIRITLI